jgi:hypothetical protein
MAHCSIVNLIEWHRTVLQSDEAANVLQFSALSFDVASQEILSTLRIAHRMHEAHGTTPSDFPVEGLAMMERGDLGIDIDSEWIKASVVRHLSLHFWRIFHSDWRIVINESNEPFVTSDNPVAILPDIFRGAAFGRSLPLSPSSCLFLAFRPDLLVPEDTNLPGRRPTVFWRGYDVYDAANVGFVSNGDEAQQVGTRFDTTV